MGSLSLELWTPSSTLLFSTHFNNSTLTNKMEIKCYIDYSYHCVLHEEGSYCQKTHRSPREQYFPNGWTTAFNARGDKISLFV